MSSYLPTTYQQFIATSRYSRWRDDLGRRETWEETVDRYFAFWKSRFPDLYLEECRQAVLNLEVMPSMRCLMTAGKALERDECSGYNCLFLAIDHPHCFDEILYALCCLHPDTLIKTSNGSKPIKDVTVEDMVLTYNEEKKEFKYVNPSAVIENKTAEKDKLELEFEDGSTVQCTADHKFLTSNRGWVEAKDLTENDNVVDDRPFSVYQVKNKVNGKSYVGVTSKGILHRFSEHVYCSIALDHDRAICKAIRKYGKESFDIILLETFDSIEDAYVGEIKWIAALDSFGPNGYNLTIGGEGAVGAKWSEEAKIRASLNAYPRSESHRKAAGERLKAAMPGIIEYRKTEEYKQAQRERNLGENNPCYGRVYSEQEKKKISERVSGEGNPFYGKHHSDETKKILSEQRIGLNAGENNPFHGKKHSEETKAKMKAYWANRRAEKSAEGK